jgi:hypothetical protein
VVSATNGQLGTGIFIIRVLSFLDDETIYWIGGGGGGAAAALPLYNTFHVTNVIYHFKTMLLPQFLDVSYLSTDTFISRKRKSLSNGSVVYRIVRNVVLPDYLLGITTVFLTNPTNCSLKLRSLK